MNEKRFKKGHVPWNKDKKTGIGGTPKGTKFSKEHKEKLKQAKLKNPVRYWLGKKMECICGNKNPAKRFEVRKKIGDANRGKKSYWWRGGKSRDKHNGSYEYVNWRVSVFTRDQFTCQICKKIGGFLEAHHIKSWAKYPDLRFDINNGITLCKSCHKLTDNYGGRNRIKLNI